jgi:AcrR family transcriptional regulator
VADRSDGATVDPRTGPTSRRGPAAKGRTRRSDGELTRARVLEAAVECILERGYYQASSNAIARRAGVTWGTIQHQFGSREALLLDLMNERWHRLQDDLREATVDGATLEERLTSVLDLLARWYGAPDYLVHVQIFLDLSSDPTTSEATREAVMAHGKELTRAWRPLFAQAMGEAGTDRELVEYAFLTLRGFLTANLLSSKYTTAGTDRRFRRLLVRGVAAAIAERAEERGLSVG